MRRPRRTGARPVPLAPQEVDGAVVRIEVTDGPWAEDIPPVPAGVMVTVSFVSDAVGDEHGDALELLGYRVLDAAAGSAPSARCADFLVSGHVIEQHRTYWRSLAERAVRVYPLAFGPAAAAVADVVAVHLRLPEV